MESLDENKYIDIDTDTDIVYYVVVAQGIFFSSYRKEKERWVKKLFEGRKLNRWRRTHLH